MKSKWSGFLLILVFFISLTKESNAWDKTYEWRGSVSSNWQSFQNWKDWAIPGNESGDQNYIVNANDYGGGNHPVISSSTNITYIIENIFLSNGAELEITDKIVTVTENVAVRRGSRLTVGAGATLIVPNLAIFDQNSSIIVDGGAIVLSNDFVLGDDDGNGNSTNGTITVTLNSGSITCPNLVFSNDTGDSPQLIISGGTFTTTNVSSSGAPVDITITGGLMDVNGNMQMDHGSDSFTLSDGQLNVAGDWTNAGTNTITGGNVVFDGLVSQAVTSATSVSGGTFYNLTTSSLLGTDIQSTVTITNLLTLAGGVVNTSSVNKVVFQDGASFTGWTPTTYISGAVTRTGSSDYTFPLSSPIGISSLSGTETFTAQYFTGSPMAGGFNPQTRQEGLSHVSTLEYWILDRDGGTESAVVTLHWNAGSDVGDTPEDRSKLLVCRWNGTQWVSHGGSASGSETSGTVTSGVITSFSPFAMGSSDASNPLPVELLYFDAELQDGEVVLDWATATEVNNEKFEIERSTDGKTFEKIAEVKGSGNTKVKQEYVYYDTALPLHGFDQLYYRLKQIDYDGAYEYSPVGSVRNTLPQVSNVKVSPNPFRDHIKVEIQASENADVNLSVFDLHGLVVYATSQSISAGSNSIALEGLGHLKAGIYFIVASGKGVSHKERIVKYD